MKRKLLLLLYAPSLLVSCGLGCCPPRKATLGVSRIGQETEMWCWAASGEMSMEFLDTSTYVTQCDQANKRLGRADCCGTPAPLDCVKGGFPEFDKYGFDAKNTTELPLTWKEIQKQIYCKKKPVAFSWHYQGGGGHMMVATGYETDEDGTRWVYRNDPLPLHSGKADLITYDNYVESRPFHWHWDDYYDITKQE